MTSDSSDLAGPRAHTVCAFPDWKKSHQSKGRCAGHYSQYWQGRPMTPLRPSPPAGDVPWAVPVSGQPALHGLPWLT
jgi:hypothetical protein